MKFFKKQNEKAFTLVEMLVVAPIVILAIGAFLTAIISMTGEVLASRASNNLAYNVQDAVNRIDQDVKLSSNFLAVNNVLGTDQGYNDDATGFTNLGGTTLILNMVATTTNPISTSSSYVFLKNKPNDCSAPQNNVPFNYNVVYFVKDNALYRRTVMPTTYNDTNIVCNVPWQQPSCSPTYMDTTPTPPSNFCKTKDILLVEGTDSINFLVQYFNSESTSSVNTAATTASATSDRTAALQSATTVSVGITASQTAAGRAVERSANLRTSRLDSNASGVAVITADSIPLAPKVTASVGAPTTVAVSWTKVAAAASYLFEYQINGGTWVPTSTTGQTGSVTTATHKDVVNIRVTAINSLGSSGYGTATVTIPLWTPFTLQNNWVDYSTPYASAAYTRTSAGLIFLKGLVKSGTGTIAVLPPGYRPSAKIMFEIGANAAAGRLDVLDTGEVNLVVGTNGWVALDGISFMPAGNTFTTPTFANGWVNYSPSSGDTTWQGAGYMTDSAGRVQLTGLIRAGTSSAETPMFTLPSGSQSPEYLIISNNTSAAAGNFSIYSTTGVLARGFTNTYLSLQTMFYPAGRATGTTCTTQWCNMTLQNSWTLYGGLHATAQYTKSSDGVVMLKGLVKDGSSATSRITTLPAGYCPAESLIVTAVAVSAWARVNIDRNADGTCFVTPSTGSSTGWLSLSNIHYPAEP